MADVHAKRIEKLDWLYANRVVWSLSEREIADKMQKAGLYSHRTNWWDMMTTLRNTFIPFIRKYSAKDWEVIRTMLSTQQVLDQYGLNMDTIRIFRKEYPERVVTIGKLTALFRAADIEAWLEARKPLLFPTPVRFPEAR